MSLQYFKFCIMFPSVDMWQFKYSLIVLHSECSCIFSVFFPPIQRDTSKDIFAPIYLCALLIISLGHVSIIVGSKERQALWVFFCLVFGFLKFP